MLRISPTAMQRVGNQKFNVCWTTTKHCTPSMSLERRPVYALPGGSSDLHSQHVLPGGSGGIQ